MTLSILRVSITVLVPAVLSVVKLRFIFTECHYAECHYAECHNAECHYANCHYAECYYAEFHGTIIIYTNGVIVNV